MAFTARYRQHVWPASRVEVLASSVVYVPDRRNETRYGLRDLRAHSSDESVTSGERAKCPNHGTQDGPLPPHPRRTGRKEIRLGAGPDPESRIRYRALSPKSGGCV